MTPSTPEISRVITPQRFAQGFTYEDYLAQIKANRERFQEHATAFQLKPADAQDFKDVAGRSGPLKALAIAEDWCPDAHRGVPIVAQIARAGGMELRIFPRDQNLDIMNLYLNQGKFQSIPVFAFFDRDFNPLCHWIERPAVATRFMQQIAAELEKLGEEERRQERRRRQAPLADSWRQETVKELKELLAQATKR